MWWIIILVAIGIGLAILIGVLGTRNEPSKASSVNSLCSSLQSLESSVESMTSLPSGSSKSQYQSDWTTVQNDWNQVKSDAQAVQNAPTGDLDNAWESFTSAVKNVPNDASADDAVNDIKQSGQQLVSVAQSTAQQVNCSGTSTTSS
jgi:hypothetical protein